MTAITDEFMRQKLSGTRNFTIVVLKKGQYYNHPDAKGIIWEHGRRNFSLREEGLLAIVCPVNDGSELVGIGIFNADVEKTKQIMDGDPGVKEGIFEYEIHPTRSFPGDGLPEL
ncbi:MAG: hypothetical protein ABSG89_08645 [Bacteroidales bacterium]|jgi:hypothetical protein